MPEKITFGEMRDVGVRGLLIYCSDYKCSHMVTMSGDRWPDDMRLSDLAPRFICSACGKRGLDGDDLRIREHDDALARERVVYTR